MVWRVFFTLATFFLGISLSGAAQPQLPPAPSAHVERELDSAQTLMQAADFANALKVLLTVMQREQLPPPDVFILMATCHLNLEETARAVELLEQGMSMYPQVPVFEDFYVKVLTDYVPIEQMKDKLDKALLASPRSLILLRASAFVELRLDARGEKTRQVVNRLLEVAPENPVSHFIYGQWARLNQQEEMAITEWEKALTLGAGDARTRMDIYTLIGHAENRLNRAERAEAAFKKALEANLSLEKPNPASALFYADFLAKQARFDESQAVIDQILCWAPTYGPALLQRALSLARVRPEEAVLDAEQALSGTDLSPEQTRSAHVLLAKTYFQLKRKTDAERHQEWLKSQ